MNTIELKSRKEKIKSHLPVKYFYEDCFDSNSRNKILSDIDIDENNNQENNLFKCGPLLTKDQEQHVFRKYNYLKYRLFKLTNLKIDRLKEKSVDEIEKHIDKIQKTRNLLLRCNTRLIVGPVSKHFERDSFDWDEFISNGYIHLMKAVDYFDYRRGFKFSTYCTWVLISNLGRDKGKMFDKRITSEFIDPQDKREEDYRIKNDEYNKSFLKFILEDFQKNCPKQTAKRRVEVLKKLYGIDGKQAILSDIGKLYGISKERVRQIKSETIELLKEANYSYDPLV